MARPKKVSTTLPVEEEIVATEVAETVVLSEGASVETKEENIESVETPSASESNEMKESNDVESVVTETQVEEENKPSDLDILLGEDGKTKENAPSEENEDSEIPSHVLKTLRIFRAYEVLYIDSKNGVFTSPREGAKRYINQFYNK